MSSRTPARRLEPPTCDDRPIWDLMLAWNQFPTLMAADELGLFPLLEGAPRSREAIRDELSIGDRACEAMLGVMVSLDLLAMRRGLFHLTDLSRNFLLPTSPYYWGGMLALLRDFPMNGATVRDAMQRDQRPSVFAAEEDKGLSDDWAGGDLDPEKARGITAAMHSHSFPAAMGVARWGDFSGANRLLDVAGGSGCFCIALAMKHPDMNFTVMELPSVCAVAREYIAEYGLEDRIDTRGIDMFRETWPSDHDAIFLSNVLHDWDRRAREHLARSAFEALPGGGRIYIHEVLLDDTKTGPRAATSFSLHILLFAEGKQYTIDELDALLRGAGFTDVELTPSYGYYSLVSARKP